ncbi:unnamed protein product [Parascedosporium putredinis]|uniref:Uncharacterized protein n=1 Tax=Parascedosporium putredinis TaxID=1442378 RepID=A0A9P1M5I8_9PEZI|nr:unnamed protein product [Parascedosporium putredinis]CAI7987295.1 unnamed protein product [Parascedosporium putredinis]
MMPSTLAYTARYPTQYAHPDPVQDSWTRQMAASQFVRRLSRSSNGQRSGSTLRVTKPTSASNSPRSSMTTGRRRTLVSDGNLAWRKQQMAGQVILATPDAAVTAEPVKQRAPRPVQHIKTALSSEVATPYQQLQESEDEGEILVGMGLYDAPEKCEADPGLNNYRSTLSSLLGGGAPKLNESPGKGLKLEETWQPPETDDEDEDDEDEDEAQGDDE